MEHNLKKSSKSKLIYYKNKSNDTVGINITGGDKVRREFTAIILTSNGINKLNKINKLK